MVIFSFVLLSVEIIENLMNRCGSKGYQCGNSKHAECYGKKFFNSEIYRLWDHF